MTFRVGLLFHFAPGQPLVPGPVADLLQKIDAKSAPIRNGRQLTLVPFVRTNNIAAFSQAVAGSEYLVEAAAFDEAGVTFGPLGGFATMSHPAYHARPDFELGMKVLLPRCDVIVIVCRDSAEASEVRKRLAAHHNTSAFLALVPTRGGKPNFLEVNPRPVDKDETDWLLAVKESWEVSDAGLGTLPARKRTALGFLFPTFYSMIIRGWAETIKKRQPTEAERCRGGMGLSEAANKKIVPSDRSSLDAVLNAVCPHFTRHDDLGRHYSNVFRTTCFLVPLFIVVSTVLAVAAAIDHARHNVWHISEGALLLFAAILFLRSKFARHHRRWVEHRLLAELLRPALLHSMFHTMPPLTLPSEEPELWIDRSRLLMRHLRALPPVEFTTPKAELLSARTSAIADFVGYQAKWHTGFAEQHRAAGKRLTRMSAYAFVVTLCLCAVQLFIAYRAEELTDYKEALTGIAHMLMMLTLLSAGGAFVLSILSHQLGFEAIAERSSNAAEHFEVLKQAIERSRHSADARQVFAWADECAGVVLAEQHSWYRHIPLIRMHL